MKRIRKFAVVAFLVVAAPLTMASAREKAVDDIMRVLGTTPGTFYNYGADGDGYVWISRGSYTVLDTALLN